MPSGAHSALRKTTDTRAGGPFWREESIRTGVMDMDFWERSGDRNVDGDASGGEPGGGDSGTAEMHLSRPFGDASFVDEMETVFQRKWRRGTIDSPDGMAVG